MSKGTCLCGNLSWEFSGQPQAAYHCHCAMCRKAHAAAFASYYYIDADDFSWLSDVQSVKEFRSSAELGRAFCENCGSVVPNYSDDNTAVYVPAGMHQDGPAIDSHIFTASKAPWHEIGDSLTQHEAFAPETQLPVIADKELPPKSDGVTRGSCLCDRIQFEVTESFKVVHNCHCSRCRRARAAAFTTNGFTSKDGVNFLKGESLIKLYKLPEAKFFTHAFCDTCGSGVPRKDPQRNIAVIPLGSLDDDPGCKADDHIFADNKANWYDICDDLPVYGQAPD